MSPITTHVLDTALGRPAEGIAIALFLRDAGGDFHRLGEGTTDADGRIRELLPAEHALTAGLYRMVFQVAEYHRRRHTPGFYPSVTIDFEIVEPKQHHHIPLLLSPFGYSTYRGS